MSSTSRQKNKSLGQSETNPVGTGQRVALVLHPEIKRPLNHSSNGRKAKQTRSAEAQLAEAVSLCEAIELELVFAQVFTISNPKPATLIGSGHIEQIASVIELHEVELVVVNHSLTPIQQRNLEKKLHTKVIDRTGLILEIFGARAATKEGTLQVELAALTYQRSRLVRSWTHLERQRGGLGFIGGPGESQLEIDRRLISERIVRLKRDLEKVRRTRDLQRSARKRVPYPIVSLVGYTNAGKSSLFNRLTGAGVFVKDMLFATLDPSMKLLQLPGGKKVILSDTVGFVSDLPHELVDAFRATLEEVLQADVLVHVSDISSEFHAEEQRDVDAVISDLWELDDDEVINDSDKVPPLISAWNKMDLLSGEDLEDLTDRQGRSTNTALISAEEGTGVSFVVQLIEKILSGRDQVLQIDLPYEDGKSLSWFYDHGTVLERNDGETVIGLTVQLDPIAHQRAILLAEKEALRLF